MKKFSVFQILGFIMAGVQFLVIAAFLILLVVLNFLPGHIIMMIGIALFVDLIFVILLAFIRNPLHWIGKIISLFTILGLCIALYFIATTDHAIKTMTDRTESETTVVYVVVKKDSSYETLQDVKDKEWGVQYAQEVDAMGKTVDAVRKELDCELNLTAYDNYSELYPDLINEKIDVMIVGSAYLDIIDEQSEEEEDPYVFSDEIRILKTYTFENQIADQSETHDFDITKDPFTVFISGIDTYGDITTKSRSDVNILMTVNPATKQILLVTTPRDAYTVLPGISGKQKDKLTHSGIYGIQCSEDTLKSIYGVDIDFYVRVNFSSVEEIVDALGGIEVYSSYDFTAGGYEFKEGYNTMDGAAALAFSRERHAFADGDFQRGRDQMEVIKGIVKKGSSKAILTGFKEILKVVSQNTETDVKTDDIYKLVKMQLSDGASWDMMSFETVATTDRAYCYSYSGKSLSVSILDEDSVKQASEAMEKLLDGKELTGADVAQK